MKSYLITYELKLPESSYFNLTAYLKSASLWARPNKSTWLIKTTATAEKIRNGMMDKIYTGDSILVIELPINTSWASFNIPEAVNNWMKDNV